MHSTKGANKLNANLPEESVEELEVRLKNVFKVIDKPKRVNGKLIKRDGILSVDDIRWVLGKIKAPRSWKMNADEILWEVSDFKEMNLENLISVYNRIINDTKNGELKEPTRLLTIIDFVSKDLQLTGEISARDCVMLLHNRFGGKVKSVNLRNLFINNHSASQSRLTFAEFNNQLNLRRMLKQR